MRNAAMLALVAALYVACVHDASNTDDPAYDSRDAAAVVEVGAWDDAPVADAAPRDAHATADSASSGACGTPTECGATWERNAAARLAMIRDDPAALTAFLRAVPKGGDLHNHLSGSVYAETYLTWGTTDGNCIHGVSLAAVPRSQCAAAGNFPVPSSGTLFDRVLRAWSMLDFVPGAESGHDHFFATFAKFGLIAGAHRNDSIADVAARAAGENQLYVETMFNLGTNVGSLAASIISGSVTAASLPMHYEAVVANADFAAQLDRDVTAVRSAAAGYRRALGCDDVLPPEACDVRVRFTAQVSRTAANDQIFGQLISAFEMASRTPLLVAANLSSPEDDTASLRNYELHMAMLDFLYNRYTATRRSPLRVTLHAGEVVPRFLPSGYAHHNTFHIRQAVEIAHAERIGHGIDVLSETNPEGLLQLMRDRQVLVEVCLSSNDQILEVRGADHPLARYMAAGVPVALATDDQGVSRSSLAGEYARAIRDQRLDYRQLKDMARASLEHAFLPGASLWTSVREAAPVAACAPTATMGVGDAAEGACAVFLSGSERARTQWELERRFRIFEAQQ